MRAPTAIEITCADPSAPCKLPNDFVSDPPLEAVLARTAEIGARGRWQAWQWSAALYQSRLSNDIEFISSAAGAGNGGYFANVGATRRTGLELSAATQMHALAISARYSFIAATFRSTFSERSPGNSSADVNAAILVTPGYRPFRARL